MAAARWCGSDCQQKDDCDRATCTPSGLIAARVTPNTCHSANALGRPAARRSSRGRALLIHVRCAVGKSVGSCAVEKSARHGNLSRRPRHPACLECRGARPHGHGMCPAAFEAGALSRWDPQSDPQRPTAPCTAGPYPGLPRGIMP